MIQTDADCRNRNGKGVPPSRVRGPAYWVRWILLLPTVGAAFGIAGIIGGVLALVAGLGPNPVFAGPLCAFVWIVVAWAMAPSHKTVTALTALCVGVVAAWFLSGVFPPSESSRVLTLSLAGCGGVGALLLCLPRETRRRCLKGAARLFTADSFLGVIDNGRRLVAGKEDSMQEKHTIRQIVKSNIWIKLIITVIVLVIGINLGLALVRGVVDIVTQDQRGLYMRLGKYIRTVEPGLHLKIPIVDRIIRVSVRERQGYIQHVDAMTQDNVIMRISLQYTYLITDPKRYRLEVQDPDTIIKEFVQGKLRDIVNTISMNDLMRKRMDLGQRITEDLSGKELGYGITFKLIQIQGTYPPEEVREAIKQSMVIEQRTVAAREEATQKEILADADLYSAQKQTEAARFNIEETAKAQKESIRMLLEELSKYEALGQKYLEYLISQELKANSKWIISGGQVPQIHLDPEK